MCESTTQQQQQQQQRHLAAIRSGFPVGAFITTSDHINEVVVSLRQHGLLKTGKNVTPFDKHRRCRDVDWSPQQHDDGVDVSGSSSSSASWFAVHVSGSLPEDVKNVLVPRSAIAFVSGLRILDDACQAASASSSSSSSSSSSTTQDAAITRAPTMASNSGQQQPAPRFTFAELFAGIGMFRLAAERAGGRCVFASEISAPPRWVYERNFGEAPSSGDITEVPSHRIPAHDILLAGFPCQSFSCAGSEAGFCDSRGMLFYEVCRVLHTKQPSAFLLENVANLVVMEEGAVLREVLTMLDACGYHVEYKVINADVVVPQHRRRVYFVGFLKRLLLGEGEGEGGDGGDGGGGGGGDGGEERLHSSVTSLFEWPPALCSPSNATTPLRLRDVLDKDPAIASDPTLRLTQSQYEMVQGRRTPLFADVNGIFPTVMSSYRKSFQKYSLFVTAAAAEDSPQEEEGDDGSRRPPAAPPCRFLSVRECARLQGIPETFILEPDVVSSAVGKSRCCFAPHGAYKLVGNAVCPLVVHPIIDSIVYTLEQLRGRSRREKEGVGEKEE